MKNSNPEKHGGEVAVEKKKREGTRKWGQADLFKPSSS